MTLQYPDINAVCVWTVGRERVGMGEGAGARGYYLFVCLSRLTIDNALFSRRGTVPAHNRDTFNSWVLSTLFPHKR